MTDSYSVASGYVNEDSSNSEYYPIKDSVQVQPLFIEIGMEAYAPMIRHPLLDQEILKEENRRLQTEVQLLQRELALYRSQSNYLNHCLQIKNDRLDSKETENLEDALFTCSSHPNNIPQPPKSLPIINLVSESLEDTEIIPIVESCSEGGYSIVTTGGTRRYQTSTKNSIMARPMRDHSSSSASANDSASEEEPERDPMIHASSLGLKHRSSLQKNQHRRKRHGSKTTHSIDSRKTKSQQGLLSKIDSIPDQMESGDLKQSIISNTSNMNGREQLTETELKPTTSNVMERGNPNLVNNLSLKISTRSHHDDEGIKSPHKMQRKRFSPNKIATDAKTISANHEYKTISDIISKLTKSDFWKSVQDRATWLIGLLILQSLSSFIISRNEQLLQQHIVIVQFLTMLVGAGGNAGNQASVNVIRGLAIGTITDKNVKQSIVQEIQVAFALSLLVGVSGWFRAVLFMIPIRETIAITASLYTIVFISVVLGAILPLFMRACHIDPAHSSTTIQVIMDILGVLITVNVSSIILNSPAMDHWFK